MANKYLSKINFEGTEYLIKDTENRANLSNLETSINDTLEEFNTTIQMKNLVLSAVCIPSDDVDTSGWGVMCINADNPALPMQDSANISRIGPGLIYFFGGEMGTNLAPEIAILNYNGNDEGIPYERLIQSSFIWDVPTNILDENNEEEVYARLICQISTDTIRVLTFTPEAFFAPVDELPQTFEWEDYSMSEAIDLAKLEINNNINNLNTTLSTQISTTETNFNTKLEELKTLLEGKISSGDTNLGQEITNLLTKHNEDIADVRSDYANDLNVRVSPIESKLNYTNIAYGTCATAAKTATKEVILVSNTTQWKQEIGSIIAIKFTTSNSASSVKIKVGNNAAYPIWYNNAEYTSNGTAYTGYADRITTYMFNGTHWVWIANSYDTNTTYTNEKLGNGYGTCSTAESTTAKTATFSSYTLVKHGMVSIKFTNAVPANATLNINSKGAKNIYYRGAKIIANVIKAGDIATFVYDGTQYQLIAIDRWQNDISALEEEVDSGFNAINAELGLRAPLISPEFDGDPKAPTPPTNDNDKSIATTAFVRNAIAEYAMVYKGTLGKREPAVDGDKTYVTLPNTSLLGDTYLITTSSGYIGSHKCESGDFAVCIQAYTYLPSVEESEDIDQLWAVIAGADIHTVTDALISDVDAIENTLANKVNGPAASTDKHVAIFSGADGKTIISSDFTIGKSVPADAKFTDTIYTLPEATSTRRGGIRVDNTTLKVKAASGQTSPVDIIYVVDDAHNHTIANVDDLSNQLNAKASKSGATFTGPVILPAPDTTKPKSAATIEYVDAAINEVLEASSAMTFEGTIGTGGTITALPAKHDVGDTYVVKTAGSYANQTCEVGDLIICTTSGTTANNAHWTVVQTNLNGAVTGPTASTQNNLASFNDTSGKAIKDSGISTSSVTSAINLVAEHSTILNNVPRLTDNTTTNTFTSQNHFTVADLNDFRVGTSSGSLALQSSGIQSINGAFTATSTANTLTLNGNLGGEIRLGRAATNSKVTMYGNTSSLLELDAGTAQTLTAISFKNNSKTGTFGFKKDGNSTYFTADGSRLWTDAYHGDLNNQLNTYMTKSNPTGSGTMNFTGDINATGTIKSGSSSLGNTYLELYGPTTETNGNKGAYIDFHYNGSTSDYTARIHETSSGTLRVYGNLHIDNHLEVSKNIATDANLIVAGTSTLAGDVHANQTITIGNGCILSYDATNKCLNFNFN